MRALFVLGRAIFGGYFVYNGLNHFLNQKMMSQYAASKGVANADVAVPASGGLLAGRRAERSRGTEATSRARRDHRVPRARSRCRCIASGRSKVSRSGCPRW